MLRNTVICSMCGGKFFPASLKFHQKACKEKQKYLELPCSYCDELVKKTDMDVHLRNCMARKLASLRLDKRNPPKMPPMLGNGRGGVIKMLGTCTIVSDKGDSGSSGLAVPPLIQKAGQDGRIPCAVCGRKFAADRIGTHQRICRKVNSKGETNVFDVASQRVKEIKDQLPPTIMKKNKQNRSKKLNNSVTRFGGKKSGASTNQLNDNRGFSAVNNKKSNWRAQHESFIASVRNAKKISAFMRNGGDAKDLASLPLINTQAESDTMQYVFCPHCSRNFSKTVAERHIPKCKNIVARPNAPPRIWIRGSS